MVHYIPSSPALLVSTKHISDADMVSYCSALPDKNHRSASTRRKRRELNLSHKLSCNGENSKIYPLEIEDGFYEIEVLSCSFEPSF